MAQDYDQYLHKEWLGLLQPEGLVVSPPALVDAQAFVDKSKALTLQPVLQAIAQPVLPNGKAQTHVQQFEPLAQQILEWEPEDFEEQAQLPESLSVPLPDYGETLRPDYAVVDPDSDGWLLLVQCVPLAADLDDDDTEETGWKATYQQKFERLLKGTQIPIGVLWNGTSLRLVYAPSGESSGHVTFPIEAMTEVPGRTILGALEMLLGADRLFNSPTGKTLPKLLEASRNYQAMVSTQLAEQVLDALWELLRGFQAADAQREDGPSGGLQSLVEEDSQHVYGGLLTTLMRLVFLLYAENQGLMPDDEIYQGNYSVSGLYEKLREDAVHYPDTMDQRYGAWAWLLSLFRLVYEGGGAYEAYLPARHGQLFDPKEYVFLEGEQEIPRVADGVIYRMLQKLLILNGERLSYRALDVEQIGSVYEAIMGYEVEIAESQSIAVRPKDVVINLEALLEAKPKDRAKLLKAEGELKLSGKAATALKTAGSVPELLAALERRVSRRTTQVLMPGALYLQPGEERRRTGSHYTPRKLTQPIVETTLRPIFERLGSQPTAEQILELKVCDLAMGSAAFLVEVCRQLAERLVAAWDYYGMPEDVPDAVEPLLYARRLVAQRCLYGVDKNPFAVNLAKLSLWLVTLARDLPFTFVDHALKCGDSLVGLTRKEIIAFGRDPVQDLPLMKYGQEQILAATVLRSQIQAGDTLSDGDAALKYQQWQGAEAKLLQVRMLGDVAVAAFFDGCGKSKKDKAVLVQEYGAIVRAQPEQVVEISRKLRERENSVAPLNWDIEFPEVFDRENPGFDVIVGNPPFLGGTKISTSYGKDYLYWLLDSYDFSGNRMDLVAYLFRRGFALLRESGCLGLIATNTIGQGDTRSGGLAQIRKQGGWIYNVSRRCRWPGLAAVVVSIIHIQKGNRSLAPIKDRQCVQEINSYLFHTSNDEEPATLKANSEKCFEGSKPYGQGFLFDDSDHKANSITEMNRLIEKNPKNAERIFPYIGGEEVNNSPTHSSHRFTIDFGEMTEDEASHWPDLVAVLREKVKPERSRKAKDVAAWPWWRYWRSRPKLYTAARKLEHVLVVSRISTQYVIAVMQSNMVFSERLDVFALSWSAGLSVLQSRIHEIWARFFGSSMKDDLLYTPTTCFETFPFPENWESVPILQNIGQTYYRFRADLMVRNNQGLTDTYNRFHDPQETDSEILKLRGLHNQMDRAVLNAYGWPDIDTTCGFALDYLDIDETNLPPEAQDRIASGDLHFSDTAEAAAFDNLIQASQKRRKKLPWRYRWPESTHDEVLARLLDLNQQRYEEEVKAGLHSKKKGNKRAKTKRKKKLANASDQLSLIQE
ncbi:hypothetical protein S7335_771 [Synechococcus sp. PCC 7335]|uniref:Eco57I restriction-modification methylase domain-containing protein n=1 Tax=Synechococcus sp. (strain ATCC 29403 / PCC 7335) TaxID=91464 RepID=UPI00017EE119|nr:type IIL restriction-modification enzyme MmeI [Synechococcus sp. PCC 7335]EDX83591.1 hypothetical protein S7335_771 [Synechococcus sp. PCC 7335]